MKYLKQLLVILVVSFISEILSYLIPIAIPSGVYGIIILFLALETRLIKLKDIEETADFLLVILPVLFVPAGVSLIKVWDKVANNLVPILIIITISTILVMAATGRVAQLVISIKKKLKEKSND